MDTNTVLTPPIHHAITDYLALLKTSGIPVDHAILFGSQAKGNPHDKSDIDLCIVSSDFGTDYHGDLVTLTRLAGHINYPMDVIPYHPNDLQNTHDPLAHEIRTHGIQIS